MISVIVPVLNAEATLAGSLASVEGEGLEVIVVDGGSSDGSREIARSAGARVIGSARGRAVQMNAGVESARGEWLVFLHADTVLSPGWAEEVRGLEKGLGAFRFRLDGRGLGLRLLEWGVALRCAVLRLPYGDQALCCRRAEFPGFPEIPIMEDVELVRRLRPLRMLRGTATTSARRWREEGVLRRSWRNLRTMWRYRRGASPDELAAFYRDRG